MNKITHEQWKELDGQKITISLVDTSPTTIQVMATNDDGDEFFIDEWEESLYG